MVAAGVDEQCYFHGLGGLNSNVAEGMVISNNVEELLKGAGDAPVIISYHIHSPSETWLGIRSPREESVIVRYVYSEERRMEDIINSTL